MGGSETLNRQETVETVPTERDPERGRVRLFTTTISEAERWVEDGVYVIRSTEFDLLGEGEDLESAIADFAANARNILDYYLAEEDKLLPHESEIAVTLASRLLGGYQEIADFLESRRESSLWDRLKGRDKPSPPRRAWEPSNHENSAQLLRA